MIIYNVTLKVNNDVLEKWTKWMRKTHIPEMLSLGIFGKSSFYKLLEQDDSIETTFVTQYFCKDLKSYQQYLKDYASKMRKKGTDLFGENVLGFRTVMENLENFNS